MNNIPIMIYDLNGNKISKYSKIKAHSYYFYGYQNMSVKIISGTGLLYSTKMINSEIVNVSGKELSNNFGYTLYIPTNLTSVVIEIVANDEKNTYYFDLELSNIITLENEHYLDLITNYNLPTFEELTKATLDDVDDLLFNNEDLLKRLLLDFRDIMKYKGTKNSINKFLKFLGYTSNLEVIDVLESVSSTNQLKVKTGDYHVIYDNNIIGGEDIPDLDANNLPNYRLQIRNIDNFFDQLAQAISLANTYFTIEEQEITKFNLRFQTNVANYLNVNSDANIIITHNNKVNFDDVTINLWSNIDSTNIEKHIKNNYQQDTDIYRSEIKIKKLNSSIPISKIFLIDHEIYDDTIIDDIDLTTIVRIFGIVCQLDIVAPNKTIDLNFYDVVNTNNQITVNAENNVSIPIAIINTNTYMLKVKITDNYNNINTYTYEWKIDDDHKRIDFDVFNSKIISDDMAVINNINLDIDAPTKANIGVYSEKTYILPLANIPDDLSQYYNATSISFLRWLAFSERYQLTDLHKNNKLNLITETISMNMIDQWLNVITLPIDPDYQLKLRIFNPDTVTYEFIDYVDIPTKYPIFDTILITPLDIEIDGELVPHYFITTTEPSINININTYDFCLFRLEDDPDEIESYESIYNMSEMESIKLPTNFDIILFPVGSTIYDTIPSYMSNPEAPTGDIDTQHTYVKSIFPRMLNVSGSSENLENTLYIGDIILCRLTDKYVVGATNIIWRVYNSFTKKLLFEDNKSFMLKYRITENAIYDVTCSFMIADRSYSITKNSIITSFVRRSFTED